MKLFCDNCGDISKAVIPCKIEFLGRPPIKMNVCLDCYDKGRLSVDIKRRLQVAEIVNRLSAIEKWRQRA